MKYNTVVVTAVERDSYANVKTVREFTLIPPHCDNYYGNGYYMAVRLPGVTTLLDYVDVRYWGAANVEAFARRYMELKYGLVADGYTTISYTFPAAEFAE